MTSVTVWRRSNLWTRFLLIVYAVAFIGATYNHVMDLVRGGWLPYTRFWGVPFGLNIYWTVLTFLDPLALVILILDTEWGLALYGLVMVSDVGVNWYSEFIYWKQPLEQSYGLMMQTGFLIFLVVTAPFLIRMIRQRDQREVGIDKETTRKPGE